MDGCESWGLTTDSNLSTLLSTRNSPLFGFAPSEEPKAKCHGFRGQRDDPKLGDSAVRSAYPRSNVISRRNRYILEENIAIRRMNVHGLKRLLKMPSFIHNSIPRLDGILARISYASGFRRDRRNGDQRRPRLRRAVRRCAADRAFLEPGAHSAATQPGVGRDQRKAGDRHLYAGRPGTEGQAGGHLPLTAACPAYPCWTRS